MTEDRSDWRYYQTHDLAVVPYMPGTPVYKDGLLPHLYVRTRDEGKIENTFCGDIPNMDEFIDFFLRRKTMQILCRVKNNSTIHPVGYSWVDAAIGVDGQRSALGSYCFLGDAGKNGDARSLAKIGIAYWMEALRIDVVHGIMVADNIQAVNFARRIGFEHVATVPDRHYYKGKLASARVVMLRKSNFMPKFDVWFQSKKL